MKLIHLPPLLPFLPDLKSNGRRAKVIYMHVAENADELTLLPGQVRDSIGLSYYACTILMT